MQMSQARVGLLNRALFLYKFLRSPRTVGSITPSSRYLAEEMFKHVDWENTRSLVELGAGTGIFTHFIQELKHPECKALIFEREPTMRHQLEAAFPHLYYYSNAQDIYQALQEMDLPQVDVIVSGLPFSNFDQELRDRIIGGVLRSLKPGGLFITFQYSLQMKRQLTKHFADVDISFVPLNVPPAFVYCCQKAE